jgi:hypothetical protein
MEAKRKQRESDLEARRNAKEDDKIAKEKSREMERITRSIKKQIESEVHKLRISTRLAVNSHVTSAHNLYSNAKPQLISVAVENLKSSGLVAEQQNIEVCTCCVCVYVACVIEYAVKCYVLKKFYPTPHPFFHFFFFLLSLHTLFKSCPYLCCGLLLCPLSLQFSFLRWKSPTRTNLLLRSGAVMP